MKHEVTLVLSPEEAARDLVIRNKSAQKLSVSINRITFFKVLKRSVDARSRNIKINLKIEIWIDQAPSVTHKSVEEYAVVSNSREVLIIGAGPAGLFAAIQLIRQGIKPIIIERGKDVKSRRRDLAAINRKHIVDPHSNYCFGEGGAGTYSDGKLYTRSTKRGDINDVLQLFVDHGADENILIEAHPHIGTNKLPKIIEAIRSTILRAGGEIHFQTFMEDLIVQNGAIAGISCTHTETKEQKEFLSEQVILATGHSARDIFELLQKKKISVEAKIFAMGVRVEHPQLLIDSLQYHCSPSELIKKREFLPAASYSLVHQVDGRGVYSFCMCPGGIIAPCATSPGEVVTNGWSPSKRNNPFANSGIVVTVEKEDYQQYRQEGALAGLRYQQALEKMACAAGGFTQTAPAQRLIDFVTNRLSDSLPSCSYQPGLKSAPLHDLLPVAIGRRLQKAFKEFGNKMPGYLSNEALIVGVESRTSSPVRIPRDPVSLQHPEVKGLYPCAEGAGYAGGIVSAAIDGQKCAKAIADIYSL